MVSAWDVARQSAETMWRTDAASAMLGMRIVTIAPGEAAVAMVVRDDMINGWGMCHGGLVASLADSAFALACNSHGEVTVAAGFDVSFLQPAQLGDELLATAEERSAAGRSGIYDVTVRRTSGRGLPLIAEFRGRSRGLGRPIELSEAPGGDGDPGGSGS